MKFRWIFLASVVAMAVYGFLEKFEEPEIATTFDFIASPMLLGWLLAANTLRLYDFCNWMGWVHVTEIRRPRTGDLRDDVVNNVREVFDGEKWILESEWPTVTVSDTGFSDRVHIRRPSNVSRTALGDSLLAQQRYWVFEQSAGMQAQFRDDAAQVRAMTQQAQARMGQEMDRTFLQQLAEFRGGGRVGFMGNMEIRQTARRADDIIDEVIKIAEQDYEQGQTRQAMLKAHAARWRGIKDGLVTIPEIHAEQNAELRQAMLEKFGLERYLNEVGAKVIAKDEYGELLEYADLERRDVTELVGNLRSLQTNGPLGWNALGMLALIRGGNISEDAATDTLWMETVRRRVRVVRVLNSTPDWPASDVCQHKGGYTRTGDKTAMCIGCGAPGEFRTYILRVPPNLNTPRAAIAWTFGLRPEEYNPVQMT